MKYPAFRPRGQEIQVGDLVRRLHWRNLDMGGTGLVQRVLDDGRVIVLWDGSLLRADKNILEVISGAD